jgi:acetoin utilization deacetylase AcuC-like enzyme
MRAGYGIGVARPVYLHHPSSLEHDPGPHPEQPARIPAIEGELAQRDWCGFERLDAPPVALDVLQAVHPRRYVAYIEELSLTGGGMIDADTYVSTGSYEAAVHAAGAAVRMVDLLMAGEAPAGFCGLRPPGHHAEPMRAMGFCLFNGIAVAARHALDAHGAERVLILDWDVHHGNGTNDIFHASREVLFVSIHESPLYPGTGPASDVGTGAGEGHTVNVPLPGGSGDEAWCSVVEHVVLPLARAFAPRLVLVSAGFDAHASDPLSTSRVTEAGFATMAGSVRRVCSQLGVPFGLVLEGGYHLGGLARSVAAVLEVVGEVAEAPAAPGETHPLAAEAAARLERWWPALGARAAGTQSGAR